MIIAQKPKMAPHIPQMKENIAKALHMEPDCLNIKVPQRRSWVLPEEKRELLPRQSAFYTRNNVVVRTSTKCCRSLELAAAK